MKVELTKLERDMIICAMEFVEAGEWPWSSDMDGTSARREALDRAAFDRAKKKLRALVLS